MTTYTVPKQLSIIESANKLRRQTFVLLMLCFAIAFGAFYAGKFIPLNANPACYVQPYLDKGTNFDLNVACLGQNLPKVGFMGLIFYLVVELSLQITRTIMGYAKKAELDANMDTADGNDSPGWVSVAIAIAGLSVIVDVPFPDMITYLDNLAIRLAVYWIIFIIMCFIYLYRWCGITGFEDIIEKIRAKDTNSVAIRLILCLYAASLLIHAL